MTKEDDVVKIKVGQFSVGIVGLKAALEEAAQAHLSSDDDICQYLFERLKSKNYVPPKSEAKYRAAFLREYKKHRGEEVEAEKSQDLEVKVLGPGCPNCDRLEQMVYQVMETENIIGNVEHVRDLKEIASYGLVGLPALVINGEVKSVGRFPRESQLKQWLKQAVER
jgi:small redox-active disulfide protein 2